MPSVAGWSWFAMNCSHLRGCLQFFSARRSTQVRFLFFILISVAVLNLCIVNYGLLLDDEIDRQILLSQRRVEWNKDIHVNALAGKDLFMQEGRSFMGLNKANAPRRLRDRRDRLAVIDQQTYEVNSKFKRIEKIQKLPYESQPRVNASGKESRKSACKKHLLTRTNRYSYGTCQPHKPTEASCLLAQTLYEYSPSATQCKTNAQYIKICSLNSEIIKSKILLKAKCERSACDRLSKEIKPKGNSASSLFYGVYTLDTEDGFLKSLRNFSTISELEAQLAGIAERSVKSKLNFVFVKCFALYSNVTVASQLLPVPPRVTVQAVASKPRSKNTINVNIVLLDSVSRAHFYRSLPKTVETFKNLRSNNPNVSPAKVFDFELFQAVHGHTTQNEHALFTGELLPAFDAEDDTPAVGGEVLFGHFKRAGYQTMWQEDLCWLGGWGLLMDLAAEDWDDMQSKLREAFVDSTGMTHSSCEILASYGTVSPFNGPEGDQICYNGKHQHGYFLQYSLDTLNAIASSQKVRPLLSFTALNTGHDDTGRRIQSMDLELSRYVTATAHDQNTLTIILADHGNTYTEYTSTILEGRFEMFHPSLFIIVPNKVAGLLGKQAMAALEANQRRLVTMIDVHHSLIPLAGSLSGSVKPFGLFAPVTATRTCDDVELMTPNLCVCEGWDSPTTNDSMKIAIVEFAIGQLNNMAQTQYIKSIKSTTSGGTYPILRSCERLRPLRFENVRERNSKSDDTIITSLDISIKAGNVVSQEEDVIHVEVKSKELPNHDSLEMELAHYDRLTMFGKYEKCADQSVHLKLCICSVTNHFEANVKNVPWAEYSTFFAEVAKARSIDEEECLFLAKRNHSQGKSVAFEVANTCPHNDFTLKISATFDNMKLSRKLPFEMLAPAGSVTFGFSARVDTEYWDSALDVTVEIVSTVRKKRTGQID